MPKQLQASSNTTQNNTVNGFLYLLKTIFISYCISVVFLFLLSVFAMFNAFSHGVLTVSVNLITTFAVFFCGFCAGRHFESKGLIFGAISGILHTLILWLLGSLIAKNFTIGTEALTALAIGTICGAVGGIVGINTKKQRRR